MPDEQGTVVRVLSEELALVRTYRNGSCEGCTQSGSCLTLAGAQAVVEIRARNAAGAREGDTVVLRMSDSAFLSASFAMYVVPVAAFITGAIGANALAARLGFNADLGAFLGGLGLCALSFVMMRIILRFMPHHEDALTPVIVSRSAGPINRQACSLSSPDRTD